jgi:hypothetical protein
MDPLFMIWFFVLPILGMCFVIVFPIFWFFIVPKISRKLTWARFGKCNLVMLTDDAGWAEIIVSHKGIPEGVIETGKREWRFLPRPKTKVGEANELEEKAQSIMLSKCILKDLGKPIWFGHAGKVPLVSPLTVAGLQVDPNVSSNNPTKYLDDIKRFVSNIPILFQKPLLDMLLNLEQKLNMKTITYLDLRQTIKQNIPQMYTPSQLKQLAVNRELYGMEKAGKQWTPLIIGGAVLVILLILGILAISFLFR